MTAAGLRIDVLVEPLEVALARPQASHVAVFDRGQVGPKLRTRAEHGDRADPSAIVGEFLRVLGLLDVVAGHDEYFVGSQGVMLLRDLLVELFYAENGRQRSSGRKRLNAELTAEQVAALAAQPPLSCDRASVLAAHRAVAETFLPRARALLAVRDLPWPAALCDVTQRRLQGLMPPSVFEVSPGYTGSKHSCASLGTTSLSSASAAISTSGR